VPPDEETTVRLVSFDLPNGAGLVTVNAELVRQIREVSGTVGKPMTTLIFDDDDHLDVLGSLGDVSVHIGL
jgi:hypothetical protein